MLKIILLKTHDCLHDEVVHCGDICTQHLQKSRIEYLCPAVKLHDTNDAGDENPYKIPMLVLIVLFYVEGPEFLHYICLSVGPSVCLSVTPAVSEYAANEQQN